MIFSAFALSSTVCVNRYLGVRSFSLVILLFLLFLIVIFCACGRYAFSLRIILMNSFRSLISFGYTRTKANATAVSTPLDKL